MATMWKVRSRTPRDRFGGGGNIAETGFTPDYRFVERQADIYFTRLSLRLLARSRTGG